VVLPSPECSSVLKIASQSQSRATTHCPNIAMDYSFYGASQQPYQYMGMPTNAYATTGIDLDAMRSVVSAFASELQRPRLLCTTANSPI
jgi:hypothetical protein